MILVHKNAYFVFIPLNKEEKNIACHEYLWFLVVVYGHLKVLFNLSWLDT
jgi:hypothetical protein